MEEPTFHKTKSAAFELGRKLLTSICTLMIVMAIGIVFKASSVEAAGTPPTWGLPIASGTPNVYMGVGGLHGCNFYALDGYTFINPGSNCSTDPIEDASLDIGFNGSDSNGNGAAPAVALASGQVLIADSSCNTVLIDHGNGWWAIYIHLVNLQVSAGQHVTMGQTLGTPNKNVTACGQSVTGNFPHVHFAFLNGSGQTGTYQPMEGYTLCGSTVLSNQAAPGGPVGSYWVDNLQGLRSPFTVPSCTPPRPNNDNSHNKLSSVFEGNSQIVEIFTVGKDANIWHNWQQSGAPGGWHGWVTLNPGGPIFTGMPTALYEPATQVDEVFARDTSNTVWHSWLSSTSGGWTAWTSLGCCVVSDLSAVIDGNNHVVIFGRGTDNAIYYKAQNPNGPGGWDANWSGLGGVLQGTPTVVSHTNGTLEVFARGGDNALYHAWQTSVGGSFTGWDGLAGTLTSDPTAVMNNVGTPAVWVASNNASMWYQWQNTGGPGGADHTHWSGWTAFIAGRTAGTVPLVRHNNGLIDAIVESADGGGAVSLSYQNSGGGFSNWVTISGQTSVIDPSNVINATGGAETFIRAADDNIYHAWQTDGTSNGGGSGNWSSFQSLGATG